MRNDIMDEFPQSDGVYLDHAGATLPSQTQLHEAFNYLSSNTLGNPHSMGPMGEKTAAAVQMARDAILDHFGADREEYYVVFTSGSTSSIKLIGESFPWSPESVLVYPYNTHTSLLGLREYAPTAYCIASSAINSGIATETPPIHSHGHCTEQSTCVYSLLALPGECNFSGSKVPPSRSSTLLRNISPEWLRASGANCVKYHSPSNAFLNDHSTRKIVEPSSGGHNVQHRWLWFLDASKLAASSPINIAVDYHSDYRPDFMCVSFYKMFGYPTGIGALLVKKAVGNLLQKRYWGGGTLLGVAADKDWVVKATDFHTRFEDGTLNYQSIAVLRFGFDALHRAGGMHSIQQHTFQLTQYLFRSMSSLFHNCINEREPIPLCEIYGRHNDSDPATQGPVITFNLKWADGSIVGFSEVNRVAIENNIQLRTGGCQEALGLTADDIKQNLSHGRTCAAFAGDIIDGRPTGAVRASLGYMSTPADCDALVRMLIENFLNKQRSTLVPVPLDGKLERISNDALAVKLRSIYLYPIKSCAGVKVRKWPLSPSGLYLDREWAVISSTTGMALTQKTHPKLALCIPRLELGADTLILTAPGMEDLTLFLHSEATTDGEMQHNNGQTQSVKVCLKCHQALKCSPLADDWFSRYLGIPCVFVRRERYSKVSSGVNGETVPALPEKSFSNEAQFLMLSIQSVDNLGKSNNDERSVNDIEEREKLFRPNFVVDGAGISAHDEDIWNAVDIDTNLGDNGEIRQVLRLRVTGPCARCTMVNVDPGRGQKDLKTLSTLARYRKEGSNVYFGQYLAYDAESQNAINTVVDSFFVYENMSLRVS